METQNPQEELLSDVLGTYKRLTDEELKNLGVILGAYRSFRGNRRKYIAYVSMPITTGKRFYDVLIEARVKSAKEFIEKFGKEALYKEIIEKNVKEGIAFTDVLGAKKKLLLIAPSVFDAKPLKWTDDAYMSLWYRVIGELAGTHVLMPGWEYSTGGIREVLFALLMQWGLVNPGEREEALREGGVIKNFILGSSASEEMKEFEAMQKIKIVDEKFKEIRLDRALEKIMSAITRLHTAGFNDLGESGPCATLTRFAQKMKSVPAKRKERDMWLNYESAGAKQGSPLPYDFNTDLFQETGKELDKFGSMIQSR